MEIEVGKVYTDNRGGFREVISLDDMFVTFNICDSEGSRFPGRRRTKYLSEFRRWAVSEHDPSTGERARIR